MPRVPIPARHPPARIGWLFVGWLFVGGVAPAVEVESIGAGVRIAGTTQAWHAERGADGLFRLRCEVRAPNADGVPAWRPLFDAGLPLVGGADFDLLADEAVGERTGPGAAAILLRGRQRRHGFDWDARVDLDDRSGLARVRVRCRLEAALVLRGLEPEFALWMDRPAVDVALDQGTASIDAGTADRRWGNCFPAALVWDDGVEVAMFVAAEALDWMSPRNLYRFRDCRVASWSDPVAGRTALGLRVVTRNFHELGPGDVTWDAWIAAAATPRPTRAEALARVVRTFASLHPTTAAPLVDRLTGLPAAWGTIAAGVDEDLRRRGVVCDTVDLPVPWTDAPLFPEDRVDRLPVATDVALASACDPSRDRERVVDGWDFTTCHGGLGLWLVHDRLRPDPVRHRFLAEKVRAMRLFLDNDLGLIRHGTRLPPHVGDKEMAWQSLMNAIETARVWRTLDRGDVDPAIGGMALVGTDGLVDVALRNDRLLPQWYDPVSGEPLVQADQPELGVVREPWQLGSHAWLLTEAAAIDGDARRLEEARSALDRIFAPLEWRVTNDRYDVAYGDPADHPVTEIFGHAWGVAACARLEAIDGDARWRERGDAFLDVLLRQSSWYESALRDDPRDRAVRNAGLFRNHAGAFTGSPWENAEAALALSVRLRFDLLSGRAPREPLLAIENLQRLNAATFFPRCCPDEALACARLADHPATSLPIEDAYTPEHGGLHGGTGRVAYMAGSAFAWELLFDALARADDPAVMLMNLDAIEGCAASLRGIERHFVAYNPLGEGRTATVTFLHLPAGRYRFAAGDHAAVETTADALAAGMRIDLPPHGRVLLSLTRLDADAEREAFERDSRDADRMAAEWAALHRALRRGGMTAELGRRRDAWRTARDAFMARRAAADRPAP